MITERTAEDLSTLIIKGYHSPGVTELHTSFLRSWPEGVGGCALGLAYIGMVGDKDVALANYKHKGGYHDPISFFSKEMNISPILAKKISAMHVEGKSAINIARKISTGEIVNKPSLYQRLKAWWFKTNPTLHPVLELVTD